MKKQKIVFQFYRYNGKRIKAKREITFELRLSSRLLLDEICFNYNKALIEEQINRSIDEGNKDDFFKWSKAYKTFIWE
ncbi:MULTISPECIES: IDEAL domain-containing protein [Clostridia]|uniref:IDEAL domain-containing protein n=1 Tax=Clostridia TaxID=186801 RepID=UPI000EA01CFF|nr:MULTISPECIES: IDEAL domain-containing protein [Clostridia]NBJ69119.1 IDEAL domain-containing protein [Roseburia sp. 1XD42-34]RKI79543.1 IDEAL domain-containing protein [Clostridium sp. 1xD42-85]